MPTGNDSNRRYKIVCESHGLIEDNAKDRIAADLVRREHQEDCPVGCEIFEPGDDEFDRASELVQEDVDDDAVECRRDHCHETFATEAQMFGHMATHADRRGEKA